MLTDIKYIEHVQRYQIILQEQVIVIAIYSSALNLSTDYFGITLYFKIVNHYVDFHLIHFSHLWT